MEFKILRMSKRVQSKLAILGFRRENVDLFREVLSSVIWNKAMEGRGAQESWPVFKDYLLQVQEQHILRKKKS